MKKIKIITPATVANISCGFDILGLALNNLYDELIISKSNKKGVVIKIHNIKSISQNPKTNIVGITLNKFMKKLKNTNLGFEIDIIKNINPGGGLGSSAASAVGTAFGVNKLLGEPFSLLDVINIAIEGENKSIKINDYHADNVVPATIGGITLIKSYNPLNIVKLKIPKNLWISLINPKIEFKTSNLRSIINKKTTIQTSIQQSGNIGGFISGLCDDNYDLISGSLKDYIAEPLRSILIPKYNAIKTKCRKNGSLGVGISGSGPSIFILNKDKQHALQSCKIVQEIYSSINIKFNVYMSQINRTGTYSIKY